MIIGISGLTVDVEKNVGTIGAGKDTVADQIVAKHYGVKVAFADPIKRVCRDIYDFTDEQLWGNQKEIPDKRYPRAHEFKKDVANCMCCGQEIETDCFLTPRYAMQMLGTEWGRKLFTGTWSDLAVRTASSILALRSRYSQQIGLFLNGPLDSDRRIVVIPDMRYTSEAERIKKAGGKILRVKRNVNWEVWSIHTSELELSTKDDSFFDGVIHNDGDIDRLNRSVDTMMDVFSGKIRPYSEAESDTPPFMRRK